MGRSPRESGYFNTESRRLVDEGTPTERLLLDAGIQEAPPDGAGRLRTLVALGIAVGAGTVTGTASAASSLGRVTALAQGKWLAAGAVSLGVAVGAAQLVAPPDDAAPSTSPAASQQRKVAAIPARPSAERSSRGVSRTVTLPSAPPSAVTEADAPVNAVAPARSPEPSSPLPREEPPRKSARTSVRSAGEVAVQVAALDRARAALREGRARQSVALLDTFDRDYPGSSLAPEATVVRVSALLALGERKRATALVRAYCQAGGRGAYGQRLMKLVGLSDDT